MTSRGPIVSPFRPFPLLLTTPPAFNRFLKFTTFSSTLVTVSLARIRSFFSDRRFDGSEFKQHPTPGQVPTKSQSPLANKLPWVAKCYVPLSDIHPPGGTPALLSLGLFFSFSSKRCLLRSSLLQTFRQISTSLLLSLSTDPHNIFSHTSS